ncbi:T9SS type A sorting domain-containing protein [Marinoscillum furvescens]|uniref:Putative secreted protein (Por secretion system target) n=1 Tax=Marinoscillum furvescens DSM 4134 TaxID=1122208 RepID=A0A3D9KYL1_MARFU|nr:T9SS type A sorting domain-containing protein [Marinoscillum furvescens]RED93659.1 putative secreted protein (Por secretion system target) [Marinoscillum furvescens DSM 4134]
MHYLRTFLFLILTVVCCPTKGQCPSDTLTTTIFSYNPYTWTVNGTTYDQSAHVEFVDDHCTLQQLNLTIQNPRIIAERVFTCGAYYWARTGETYEIDGTYTSAGTDDAGNPVTYELTLTINNSYGASTGTTSCDEWMWHELELPIGDGEGSAVSIDGSGTIVAIGNHRVGELEGGAVSVYQWTVGGWQQLGDTLQAEHSSDKFGHTVSLSTDGKRLAVGAPYSSNGDGTQQGYVKVYEWNGTQWEQQGIKVIGLTRYDEFGYSVDLNNDGTVFIAGAQSSNRVAFELGEARVYQWVGDAWVQLGDYLYEYEYENIPDNHGSDVAISGDGQTVMVGAWYARHSNGAYAGGKHIIYDWDGSSWQERTTFHGYRRFMQIGRAVTLNEEGTHYASAGSGDRTQSGIVFASQGTLGELHSDVTGDLMGRSLSLNQQGNILAVSSAQNDDVAQAAGKVAVYRFAGGKWNQLGQTIFGEVHMEQFGTNLEINGDGTVMIVGSNNGINSSGDPVIGTHVYYLGCATNATTCSSAVVYKNGAWSNTTGPESGDVVFVEDDLMLSEDLEVAVLTVTAGNTLTVNSGVTLDIKGDTEIEGELIVNSGGSLLTYEGNDFQGNVTFKRTTRYADGKYSFVGSPIYNDWTQQADVLAPIVYRYDQYLPYGNDGLSRWLDASTYYLISYLGFAAAGQQEITLTGIPNVGSHSGYMGYAEDTTTNSDHWGWHLLSNPYGAALDVSAFLAGNSAINGFVALWDDPGSDQARGDNSDYLIANALGTVAGPNGGQFTGYIGVMQGFFVQMAGANGTVTFTENMRVSGHNADTTFFRKTDELHRFWLTISDQSGNYSETLVGFHEEATVGRDRLFDATRQKVQSAFNVYTLLEQQALAIQGLPKSSATIAVGHDLGSSQTVDIAIKAANLPAGSTIKLRDNRTGETHDVGNEPVPIKLQAGVSVHQLDILVDFGDALNTNPGERFRIHTFSNYWMVSLGESGNQGVYQLLNFAGQLVGFGEWTGNNLELQKPATTGVYLLRLQVGNRLIVRKLIVE